MELLLRLDAGSGADDEEVAALAALLREELVATELDPVAVQEAAPPGAKGLGAELGSLLVVLAASGGVLTTLVGTLQAWLLRHADSKVVLEIDGDRLELTGATDDERRRALEHWLARHEPAGAREARGARDAAG